MSKPQSNALRTALRDFLTTLITKGEAVIIEDAAAAFIAKNRRLVRAHAKGIIREWTKIELRGIAGERPEDHGQLALFPGLPTLIRVDDGTFKPYERCTWADIQAGRVEREENIRAAEKRLALYDLDADRLRPYLEPHPELTVGDVKSLLIADEDGDPEESPS